MSMQGMAFTLANPTLYKMAGKTGKWFMKKTPFLLNNNLNPWYQQREMPEPPKESFHDWYKKNRNLQNGE
ncbi:MAG: hypothetical protein COW65_15680 [Cytophagales bacterium CG18_big_fil_WC_8_21_14_2_50_42_9]|nr:MAG: hypothetical protein COW65_15680 [Cytophagales bacterium CG18_big_fil_WC_8_21_14_2_50_42_9]